MVEQVVLKSIYDYILLNDKRINTSVSKNTNEAIRWVLVFSLNNLKKEVGITENGYWGIKIQGVFCLFDQDKSLLFFMNLLENSIEEIKDKILSLIVHFKESTNINNIFPFLEIVQFVFVHETSDYWLNLAFEWYEQFHFSNKQCLKESIENLMINKSISQKTRHRAKRELSELNKEIKQ